MKKSKDINLQTENEIHIKNRLRQIRESKGVMIKDIAADTDIDANLLAMYERNERTPSIKNAVILAEHYNITLDFLFCRSTEFDIIDIKKTYEKINEELKVHFTGRYDKKIEYSLSSLNEEELSYVINKLAQFSRKRKKAK